MKERNGKCRGSQHLAGAVVLPSEEDSQTFSVNFATGEIFKVRYNVIIQIKINVHLTTIVRKEAQ